MNGTELTTQQPFRPDPAWAPPPLLSMNDDKVEETREKLRIRCKEDMYFLAKGVLRFRDLKPALHMKMSAFLSTFPWNSEFLMSARKNLRTSRDHFKSTLGSIALPIYLLINNPQTTIVLTSAVEDNTVGWLYSIKRVFMSNDLFRWLFWELVPPDFSKTRWSATEATIQRNEDEMPEPRPSITAASIVSGQASKHYFHQIYDDIVNEKTIDSPSMVRRAIDLYQYGESLLRDFRGSTITNLGTPWGLGDVQEHIFENEIARGEMLYWSLGCYGNFMCSPELVATPALAAKYAYDGIAGDAIFPERHPKEDLERIERKIGPFKFSCQYRCDPFDPSMGTFKTEWLHYFKLSPTGDLTCECDAHRKHQQYHRVELLAWSMQVDPAYSDKTNAAQSAIAVNGIAPCACRFLFDAWRGHVEPNALMDEVVKRILRWKPFLYRVGIEAVASQRIFRFWFDQRTQMNRAIPDVDWLELKPDQGINKIARIRGQQLPLANGEWHVLPGLSTFLGDYTRFPRCEPIDLLDAWAYCDQAWLSPVTDIDDDGVEEYEENRLNPVTGY